MLYHRLHHDTDSSKLVVFGKGLGGCLSRELLQLLSKVRRTTLSSALGHRKLKAHFFERKGETPRDKFHAQGHASNAEWHRWDPNT